MRMGRDTAGRMRLSATLGAGLIATAALTLGDHGVAQAQTVPMEDSSAPAAGQLAPFPEVDTYRLQVYGDEFAEEGTCFLTGKPSQRRVVFAKSY